MLRLNNRPVLSGPGLTNEIRLTDTAYSDMSVVHMDVADAPRKHDLVWVTIHNPSDDPDNPFMLQRWMYVEQVLFQDYRDPFEREEDGTPVLDENDNPVRRSLRDKPGIVKVILREHKHCLSLSRSEDYFNIPTLLPYAIPNYHDLHDFKMFNYLSWEDMETFISHIGIEFSIADGDEPPVFPVNLYWKGLLLSDCLDDLCHSFGCRVVEKVNETPTYWGVPESERDFRDLEFLENLHTLTHIEMRRRKFVDLPNDIKYDTIFFPEESAEYRQDQIDRTHVYFLKFNSRDFEGPGSINAGLSLQGAYTFHCDKVIAHADLTEIREYIKSTNINRDLYYAFTTKVLPESFLTEHDWSTITYTFTGMDYDILVQHTPRDHSTILADIQVSRSETYKATIAAMSGGSITVTNLRNLTDPNKTNYLTKYYTLPFEGMDPSNIGKDLTFKVENNALSQVSLESVFNPFGEYDSVPPRHNGSIVESIVHSVDGLDFATEDQIDMGWNPVYNYKYHSHTLDGSSLLRTYEWTNQDFPVNLDYWRLVPGAGFNSAKVRFEMVPDLDGIKEYLRGRPIYSDLGEKYIEGAANYWYNTYRYVDIYFTFSPHPLVLDWRYSAQPAIPTYSPGDTYYRYLSPDVDTKWFTGPAGYVPDENQAFPYTFPLPDRPITTQAIYVPFYGTIGLSYDILVREIATRYIRNHLETFPATISLNLVP